jgi:hypothetical protein
VKKLNFWTNFVCQLSHALRTHPNRFVVTAIFILTSEHLAGFIPSQNYSRVEVIVEQVFQKNVAENRYSTSLGQPKFGLPSGTNQP